MMGRRCEIVEIVIWHLIDPVEGFVGVGSGLKVRLRYRLAATEVFVNLAFSGFPEGSVIGHWSGTLAPCPGFAGRGWVRGFSSGLAHQPFLNTDQKFGDPTVGNFSSQQIERNPLTLTLSPQSRGEGTC